MNPSGAKLIRRFYRAKFGVKVNYKTALKWYRSYNPKQKS